MVFGAIARFLGLGFAEPVAASTTSGDDDPDADDETELKDLDLDFTNDYSSDLSIKYLTERMIGAKDRVCLRFAPKPNSSLPTFSFRHNEMSFTDEYEEADELVKKVLTGYAGVEKRGKIRSNGRNTTRGKADRERVSGREVKVRDFATEHPIPTIFHARKKALHFHYLRYLHRNHVFDFPIFSFTPEDVHRLLICGFIEPDEWDDCFLLSAMLSVGAYKCHRRVNPLDPDGKVLPPRGPWTISANSRPPTPNEVAHFIFDMECARYFTRVRSYAFEASKRAGLTVGYLEHRIEVHGVLGLNQIGIDDDAAQDIILIPDKSYIPPELFNRDSWKRHPGDRYCCYCAGDSGIKPKASLRPTYHGSPSVPASAQADSSDHTQSGSTPPPEPETPESGSTSKSGVGKKRTRSLAPEGAERPSRSKRVRLARGPGVPVDSDMSPSPFGSVTPPFGSLELGVLV